MVCQGLRQIGLVDGELAALFPGPGLDPLKTLDFGKMTEDRVPSGRDRGQRATCFERFHKSFEFCRRFQRVLSAHAA
jgi:hypothetical protein